MNRPTPGGRRAATLPDPQPCNDSMRSRRQALDRRNGSRRAIEPAIEDASAWHYPRDYRIPAGVRVRCAPFSVSERSGHLSPGVEERVVPSRRCARAVDMARSNPPSSTFRGQLRATNVSSTPFQAPLPVIRHPLMLPSPQRWSTPIRGCRVLERARASSQGAKECWPVSLRSGRPPRQQPACSRRFPSASCRSRDRSVVPPGHPWAHTGTRM